MLNVFFPPGLFCVGQPLGEPNLSARYLGEGVWMKWSHVPECAQQTLHSKISHKGLEALLT